MKQLKTIILFFFIGTTSLLAQQGTYPTTLVNPEWEFFDDFEGQIDNTFWLGNGIGANYGVDRVDATSKVLEMLYIPNSEGNGDSWSEYDFNLVSNGIPIQAVQVEVSFKMFTPTDYTPVENNHKFFYLHSGNYGNSVANIVINSEGWGNGTVALPSINPGIDQVNYGHSWNRGQIPIWEAGAGSWSTYQVFLEVATGPNDYGFYEIFKDGVFLTATYEPTLSNWGWTGNGNPNFNSNELIKYATSTINGGGNFIDKGTLLGWANGDSGGGFLVDTKFLIDDFRIRANSVHGAVKNTILSINDKIFNNTISITPNPTTNTFTIDLKDEVLKEAIIYNHLGQQIKDLPGRQGRSTTNQVNISNLSNGIYFVKITFQSGKTATKKVIKD